MEIPFVDLAAQYRSIRPEVEDAIARVFASCQFVGGSELEAFESELAAFCGPGLHAVGCANGTDALYLVLRALGVGSGDEVITVAHTFIATTEAISLTGARPVFVDVLEDTLLMNPDAAAAAVTPRTRALLPVHLYGQTCEMDKLRALASRHGLALIEDAAQAHGARFQGVRAGALGDAACFSFYPGKNLGAYGDGGAVVSRDARLVEKIRRLANHGRVEKYVHSAEGVNSRLDGLQAAILRVKLRHLDAWNSLRRERAASYGRALRGIRLPSVRAGAEPVWHLYVVRSKERDALQERLARAGIQTGVHYPVPLHLQPAYERLGIPKGALLVTERAAREILSLPMFAELTEEAIARIADLIC
jgi:dTDP-4-amino-4,6-dideoxygalactose transaminase